MRRDDVQIKIRHFLNGFSLRSTTGAIDCATVRSANKDRKLLPFFQQFGL